MKRQIAKRRFQEYTRDTHVDSILVKIAEQNGVDPYRYVDLLMTVDEENYKLIKNLALAYECLEGDEVKSFMARQFGDFIEEHYENQVIIENKKKSKKRVSEGMKGCIKPLGRYFRNLFPQYDPGKIGEVVFTDGEMFGDLERKGLTGCGVWIGYQHDMYGSPNREYFAHVTDVVYNEVVPAFKDYVANKLGGDPDKVVVENRCRDTDMYRLYYIENGSFIESRKRGSRKSLKEMREPFDPEKYLSVYTLKQALLDKNPNFSVNEDSSGSSEFLYSWKGSICGSVTATQAGYVLTGPDENYIFRGSSLAAFDADLDSVIQDCRAFLQEEVKRPEEIFIEVLEDGEWKVMGQDRNGPSSTAKARVFVTRGEAKKSGLYRTLVNQGYSEEDGTLRLTTDEKNV